MKKMKKILIALLAMILCLGMLASCNSTGDDVTTPAETTVAPEPPKPPKVQVNSIDVITWDEATHSYVSDYTIVYGARAEDWVVEGAKNLQKALKIITGVEIPLMKDSELDENYNILRNDKEILFGHTNRDDEYTVPEDMANYKDGFALFIAYERVVILPGSSAGAYFAVCDFIDGVYKVNLEDLNQNIDNFTPYYDGYDASMTLNQYFNRSRTFECGLFPYLSIDIQDFKIWHDGSYEQKRMAYAVQSTLKSIHKINLPVVTGEVDASDLLIKLEVVPEHDDPNAVAPGEWRVTFTGNTFNVQASTYYGFCDAGNYFETELNQYGFFNLKKSGATATGDYLDRANGFQESSKYAYDKQGEYRVMFYNVLFGNSAQSDDGKDKWSAPATERNDLQALMIAQYMPDVLGCQEFDWSKRGGAVDRYEVSHDLAAQLAELGYVEAIDPRVKNAVSEANGGWGTNGAMEVTVGDETFKTYYNNTPLFYNAETTKLVDAGYHWYKNQWDKRIGSNHNNSAGDCGSKSATWGVFESLESGERYIVISTHMCTRSMYIRGLQATEIALVIDELVAEYKCPVFFGGDMNGNSDDVNYIYFRSASYDAFVDELKAIVAKGATLTDAQYAEKIKESFGYTMAELEDTFKAAFEERANVGYKSLQDDDLASIYTAKTASNHGYPDFDNTTKMMTPGENNKNTNVSTNYGGNSIDQIFVTNNGEEAEINVFGVVVDNYTMSASDHLPLFVDFDIVSDYDTDPDDTDWGPIVTD